MKEKDLLNGWKDIAKYLDVSEKTARRWEQSDNLPTLRPARGYNLSKAPVLARKSALDQWLQGTLERIVLDGDRLVALGIFEKIIWSYEFPASLRPFTPEELVWRVQRVGLHDKRGLGVLVTVRFLDASAPDRMYYFSSEGNLQWELEAQVPLLDRDGTSFEQAWTFKHVVVAATRGKRAVWAALANEAGWAGCVLHVDPHGKPTVQLANAGHVERLCYVPSADGDCLITCGENNGFEQSFVALVRTDDPPCSSPAGRYPRYRYENAPAGFPVKYILFPRTELIAARQKPYGHASGMRQYPAHIVVEVETGGDGGFFLYHFSRQLQPKYVFPSGSHEFRHRELELGGKIDHSFLACPELDHPLPLKIWESASGWREEEIRWRDNPWKDT